MTDRTLLPVPDGLVLLTFDDANHSDLANVAPLLLQHGFGATFFVSEGLGFAEGKPGEFMNWEQIRQLHDLGFEIGNHTRSHLDTTQLTAEEVRAEIDHIQRRCAEHGIPAPSSFCYPGFHHSPEVVRVVASAGFEFARRGVYPEYSDTGRGARGPAYDPRADHPLLIPTTGYAGPEWTLDDLAWAVAQARDGRIASICFHGVPLRRYHWVSTELDAFTTYMQYLADAGCTVIACRDLADYVDPAWAGADPYEAISRRARFAAIDLKCEYRDEQATGPMGGHRVQSRHTTRNWTTLSDTSVPSLLRQYWYSTPLMRRPPSPPRIRPMSTVSCGWARIQARTSLPNSSVTALMYSAWPVKVKVWPSISHVASQFTSNIQPLSVAGAPPLSTPLEASTRRAKSVFRKMNPGMSHDARNPGVYLSTFACEP